MELLLVSKPGAAHVVQHYMYFVSKSAAAEAASAIRKLGFVADVRLSAEGDKYLVLVQHVVVPTEENIAAARKVMSIAVSTMDGRQE
jgi:hypothetical protein